MSPQYQTSLPSFKWPLTAQARPIGNQKKRSTIKQSLHSKKDYGKGDTIQHTKATTMNNQLPFK